MQEADKRQARDLLIQSKVYRALAILFAVGGLGIFLTLYFQYFGGDIVKSLQDPMLIIFVVFPFVPAILLSLKAKKAEKALSKLLSSGS